MARQDVECRASCLCCRYKLLSLWTSPTLASSHLNPSLQNGRTLRFFSSVTTNQNDVQVDIEKFVQTLSLLFPKRYYRLRQRCQKHRFANISALRATIEHQEQTKKLFPYLVAIIILIISILLSIRTYHLYQESEQMATVAEQYIIQMHREQEMIEKVSFYVERELEPLEKLADSLDSYTAFTQHPLYMGVWQAQADTRDSLANTYADDSALRHQCVEMWIQRFGNNFIRIDTQVKKK